VTNGAQRVWAAGRPVDVLSTLGPLRRGTGDPAHRVDAAGRFWSACRTPVGDGTLSLTARGPQVSAQAWGAGADWLLERLPTLLGGSDDWSALDVSSVPVLARTQRARPGLRLANTGLVLDALVPSILEQKVTGQEAWRSWRQLVWRFGTPAPGPGERLRVPPAPQVLLGIPTWEWHRMGVDLRRQRTIRAAATVAARLEECAGMPPAAAAARLRLVPGIGAWTAAETVQRALGAPDVLSVGDYHLPNVVVHLLTGRPRGTDAEMLELLAPWAGQRQRVMRLIEATGIGAPRFGPRFAFPEIRAM
jgi:3-methyladenine DNA glycosylase/8-oxoguanine DNA glycosylase